MTLTADLNPCIFMMLRMRVTIYIDVHDLDLIQLGSCVFTSVHKEYIMSKMSAEL
jgi:hypothetical protein